MTSLYIYDKINGSLDYSNLTAEQEVYYGKKLGTINILVETSIQTTLWLVKASLLLFYYTLT
jgi:hypothetical protein